MLFLSNISSFLVTLFRMICVSIFLTYTVFEFLARYELSIYAMFLGFVIIVFTDTAFFICMSLSIFHGPRSSVICYACVIYGCSITTDFAPTMILSHASLCLAVVYVMRCYVFSSYVMSYGILVTFLGLLIVVVLMLLLVLLFMLVVLVNHFIFAYLIPITVLVSHFNRYHFSTLPSLPLYHFPH
jgi:hypothetical protein